MKKIIALLLISLLCLSCGEKENVHKIGVVLSLTDKGATYGVRSLHGMQIAIDELNKDEYFTDSPLELKVEDTQSKPATSLTAFKKLIDVDKIQVVLGMVLSDEVLVCASTANQSKVVILTPGAGSIKIKNAGDYIFRNRESANLQARIIAKLCVERFGFKDIGILHSNAANGISYKESFKEEVDSIGAKIIFTLGYNEGKTDYRAEILEMKRRNIKAVYLAGLDTEMGTILKQAKELNFETQFFASAGAVSKKLLAIAKDAAEGIICATAPFDIESKNSKINTFVSLYEKKYNEKPDWVAANSYDAVFIIAKLFKEGNITGEQIKNALYNVKDFPGIGGVTTFDKFGEVIKPVELVIIKNNQFIKF